MLEIILVKALLILGIMVGLCFVFLPYLEDMNDKINDKFKEDL
tara:strand:+ start:1580 stop:1708 length:129 start_codon:yes stop_codon:yes gene_type:complete